MVYYFCHCMCLHACLGEIFILDSSLANFFCERNCPFGFLLEVFYCGVVALSLSFFSFGVLDGRL